MLGETAKSSVYQKVGNFNAILRKKLCSVPVSYGKASSTAAQRSGSDSDVSILSSEEDLGSSNCCHKSESPNVIANCGEV